MKRKHLLFSLILLFLLTSFFLNRKYNLVSVSLYRDSSNYNKSPITNLNEEIIFVFISNSSCPGSTAEELPSIIEDLKVILEKKSRSSGYNFIAIAVANDSNVKEGLNHLDRFGYFDELISGNGWYSTGSIRYIYEKISGPTIIPQIIVTKRKYNTVNHQGRIFRNGISDEKQLRRITGLNNIKKWHENEAPLPTNLF